MAGNDRESERTGLIGELKRLARTGAREDVELEALRLAVRLAQAAKEGKRVSIDYFDLDPGGGESIDDPMLKRAHLIGLELRALGGERG